MARKAADVLLADDDPDIRGLTADVLESIGCSVTAVGDGLAALEHVSQSPPDLVVLDIRMPKLDGLEVTQRLRADPVTGAVPILLVSASVGETQAAAALAAGADAFLGKPFAIGELRRVARELLEGSGGSTAGTA